ncbi:hypothetical protein AgCh_017479 [Apium graveolens]
MRFLVSSSVAPMKFEQVSADALGEGAAIRQKNMEAVEGRNRRALGDMGNLFTGHGIEGKQHEIPQVSRPVTRVIGHQKKVTVKARPKDIIIIIPDTEEAAAFGLTRKPKEHR